VENSKRGLLVVASIVAVITGAFVLFSSPVFQSLFTLPKNDNKSANNTDIASVEDSPSLVLVVLKGDEDHSPGIKKFKTNNTDSIPLVVGQHIRFESPDYRAPESMKVIAKNTDSGTIRILLKSYNVNNEFFIRLEEGSYQLQVQATWFELGTHFYTFNISVI
jgi:hypothetical protein